MKPSTRALTYFTVLLFGTLSFTIALYSYGAGLQVSGYVPRVLATDFLFDPWYKKFRIKNIGNESLKIQFQTEEPTLQGLADSDLQEEAKLFLQSYQILARHDFVIDLSKIEDYSPQQSRQIHISILAP